MINSIPGWIMHILLCIALFMVSILVACAVAIIFGMEEKADLEEEDHW